MRVIILALCTLTLAGCNLAYRLPEGAAQTAQVRISAPEARFRNSVGVYVLTREDSCIDARKLRQLGAWQMGGMAAKDVDIGMHKLKGSNYSENTYVEIPVVADQRLNIALQGSMAGKVCSLTVSFLPKAGHQYEATYLAGGDQCLAVINELVMDNGKVRLQREVSAKRNELTCTLFWN